MHELNVPEIISSPNPSTQALDRGSGEIRCDIRAAVGSHMLQDQSGTATYLQYAVRFQCLNALDRSREPLLHLLFGDLLTGVAAGPAEKTRTAIPTRAIGLLVESLPFAHDLLA